MLETLDPVNRVPAASGDRREGSQVALGSRRTTGRADHDCASAEPRGGNGSTAPAGGGPAGTPWASDWLQLSHELRTPLNAMLGNIELLLDGSAGPLATPVRACIGDLQVASRQLLRQLQPLLLLVQARTAGPIACGPAIDLLALIREAAAKSGPAPHLPESTRLMIAGDPVWLGALAAALVDLHAASPQADEPLSIALEARGKPGTEPEQPDGGGEDVVMRASWPGLAPAAASPLSLALIDAALALHGGRILSLSADGLRLDLAGASVVRCSMSGRGCR